MYQLLKTVKTNCVNEEEYFEIYLSENVVVFKSCYTYNLALKCDSVYES